MFVCLFVCLGFCFLFYINKTQSLRHKLNLKEHIEFVIELLGRCDDCCDIKWNQLKCRHHHHQSGERERNVSHTTQTTRDGQKNELADWAGWLVVLCVVWAPRPNDHCSLLHDIIFYEGSLPTITNEKQPSSSFSQPTTTFALLLPCLERERVGKCSYPPPLFAFINSVEGGGGGPYSFALLF